MQNRFSAKAHGCALRASDSLCRIYGGRSADTRRDVPLRQSNRILTPGFFFFLFFLSFVIADGTISAFQMHLVVDFAEHCDDTVTSLRAVPMATTIKPHWTRLARAKRTARPPSSRTVDLNCETAPCRSGQQHSNTSGY